MKEATAPKGSHQQNKVTTKISQKTIVFNHLNKGLALTSMEAFARYNITRLAAIVHDLRNEGHIVIAETRKHDGGTHASYTLLNAPQKSTASTRTDSRSNLNIFQPSYTEKG